MAEQPLKKVVLIGARGTVGSHILKSLRSNSDFEVTIVTRTSTSSSFHATPGVILKVVDDAYPEEQLVEAFNGQDAVIAAVSMSAVGEQRRFIDAAIKAGVKRFVPTDWANPASETIPELAPLFQQRTDIGDYLRTKESTGLTWSSITCGPWFDWAVRSGHLGFDLAAHKASVFDDGRAKLSTTTLSAVGNAVAGLLRNPEATANKTLYIVSFTTSQSEILASLEKATGDKWEVNHRSSADEAKEGREKFGKGDMSGVVQLGVASLFVDGGSPFPAHTLANELLGLPKESLDEVIADVVKLSLMW